MAIFRSEVSEPQQNTQFTVWIALALVFFSFRVLSWCVIGICGYWFAV
jgi:isoprenylcysteine carboxyl methyltransferase (ICMT) family protein YpbQ